MAILEKEVWVTLTGANMAYFKNMGYTCPERIDNKGRLKTKRGAQILVKIEHLSPHSTTTVTKICDNCGKVIRKIKYERLRGTKEHYCMECKCLNNTHPHIAKMLKNKDIGFQVTYGSRKKTEFICPDCKYVDIKQIKSVVYQGFSCNRCSDGVSYPEKFMTNLLIQLKCQFVNQLSKTSLSWCDNYKYDFFLPELNCIIETHGAQHYEESHGKWGIPLYKIQLNDKVKEKLAKDNKITNYITIDCRKSEAMHLKKSILESELPKLLNFKECDVNWLSCHDYAKESLIKKCCDLWDRGMNVEEIEKALMITDTTIRRYIAIGLELNLCKRNIEDLRLRKIVQLTKEYEFIREWEKMIDASKKLNIHDTNIRSCCKGKKRQSAGGYKWMYKEDYDKYIEEKNNDQAI